jgi:uncharacterized protein DUF397
METGWFKSSRSGEGSDNCVEVRITDLAVGVRDSKNSTGPSFWFPQAQWRNFVRDVDRDVDRFTV